MISIYVYSLSGGFYLYKSTGVAEYVIYDVLPENDFTLTPPPERDSRWRWIDGKWIADDTAP